jgi:hypothetical protein
MKDRAIRERGLDSGKRRRQQRRRCHRPRGMQRRFHGCNSTMHGQHKLHIAASRLSISQRHTSARRTRTVPAGDIMSSGRHPGDLSHPRSVDRPSRRHRARVNRVGSDLVDPLGGTSRSVSLGQHPRAYEGSEFLRHTPPYPPRDGSMQPHHLASGSPILPGMDRAPFPLVMAPLAIDPHGPVRLDPPPRSARDSPSASYLQKSRARHMPPGEFLASCNYPQNQMKDVVCHVILSPGCRSVVGAARVRLRPPWDCDFGSFYSCWFR